jgi:hypothetical protein
MEEVSLGLTGMAWNRGIWFWTDFILNFLNLVGFIHDSKILYNCNVII